MILEIVIVCLVSIPSIIYAFRKIKKARMGCCSCEQDVETDTKNENQPENMAEKMSLIQMLIQKFTPRRQQATNVSSVSV